ncbi:MAG TPA: RAMP superfamily CRISPR-associated protein [Candidatus Angelobacter sp.]|nr:RAMP superfamily CRISPR-associated protein [Candidatus Angelobacter sp.]
MFQKALNELTVSFQIAGRSPLFIKDGRYEKERGDNASPDAIFISSVRPNEFRDLVRRALKGSCTDFYIPGASLKGAWRSYLEKALRSLDSFPKVCDPLVQGKESTNGEEANSEMSAAENAYRSCSDRLMNKEGQRPDHPYRDSCPVCRLFGSTAHGSRISMGDAKCEKGTPLLAENNAISRQTGAAIAPFKTLVIRDAIFVGTLRLRNFELWHLGLLARLFDDLKEARVPLGAGKNKGWGRTCVTATSIELAYFGLQDRFADDKLRGAAELLPESQHDHYGIHPTRDQALPQITARKNQQQSSLWRNVREIASPEDFWNATRSCFDMTVWDGFQSLAELQALVQKRHSEDRPA